MKRKISLFTVAVFLTAGLAFAGEMHGQAGNGMMHGQAGDGMMWKRMMHHGMMEKAEMVASNDGGVIVMMGNKLFKYDRNLNLVKEVELKIDMESMCQRKKMHEGSETPQAAPAPETAGQQGQP